MAGGEVEIRGPVSGRFGEVLTPEALAFVAGLQREFGPRRVALLQARAARQAELDAGGSLDFLAATRSIREAAWTVAPAPRDCQRRWVEITGPAERKMIINALNCGADVFMADFEDANTPTWTNMVQGQVNLIDAIERTIEYQSPDGRRRSMVRSGQPEKQGRQARLDAERGEKEHRQRRVKTRRASVGPGAREICKV